MYNKWNGLETKHIRICREQTYCGLELESALIAIVAIYAVLIVVFSIHCMELCNDVLSDFLSY